MRGQGLNQPHASALVPSRIRRSLGTMFEHLIEDQRRWLQGTCRSSAILPIWTISCCVFARRPSLGLRSQDRQAKGRMSLSAASVLVRTRPRKIYQNSSLSTVLSHAADLTEVCLGPSCASEYGVSM